MEEINPILEFIGESDIPFEIQFIKDSKNEEIWNQYLNHKQQEYDQQIEETKIGYYLKNILIILFRRFKQFPKNYEYWNKFIDFYIENFNSKNEINNITKIFLNLIDEFGLNISFWIKFLKFLIKFEFENLLDSEFILTLFNIALLKLKPKDHYLLWNLIFNDFLKNNSKISLNLKFDLYSSFFIYLKNINKFNINIEFDKIPNFDEIFSILIENMNNLEQINQFDLIFNELINPKYLLKLSDSELELFRRYMDKLIKLSNNGNKIDLIKLKDKINKLFLIIIKKFPDQLSIFVIKYAKYFIQINQFDESINLLENYLNKSLTIKDFTLIFDSLTEILEDQINKLSEFNNNIEENKISKYLDKLELLLKDRMILLNDVKLRQNLNNPSIWIERIEILKNDNNDNNDNKDNNSSINKILDCYSKAVLTIDIKKVPKDENLLLPEIWCNYAKEYFKNGDIKTCRTIFETSTKVPWIEIEQLEFIWINWIKFEINLNEIEHATLICSKAISIPKQIFNGKINIDDENLSVQMKLFKSIKLWSLYLDLIENTKNFEEICKAYEDSIELKIINGVLIVNYCLYLEESGYIEKSFSIFERGLEMFNGESKSILYCIYLNKILKYWEKLNWNIERVREIFENGLEMNYNNNLKQIYILYSEWENKYGSKIRSCKILREGIDKMNKQKDKLLLYKILIIDIIENKGLEWVVEIFQEAIENISVQIPGYINELVCGFVEVEIELGNINKSRKILQYCAENIMEFGKSNEDKISIWELFKAFELENGNETTYKEMLRLKRYLENVYGKIQINSDIKLVEETESKNAKVRKELQDRIGFVASSSGPKTTTFTMQAEAPGGEEDVVERNGDAIDLDMDMEVEDV